MANPNNPFGLRYARKQDGGCATFDEATIATTQAGDIMIGDTVKRTGTGKNIQIAAGSDQVVSGVFMGCRYAEPDGRYRWDNRWPDGLAATEAFANIINDPQSVFLVETDTLANTDIGKLCDLDDGAGDPKYGQSGKIALATEAVTEVIGGKALKILGLADGSEYGDHAIAEVIFNSHSMP